MSPRRLATLLVGIVAASLGLLLALELGLPALAAVADTGAKPLWIFVAPLLGGAAALTVALRAHLAVARGTRDAEAIGDLPTWLPTAFAGGALLALLIGGAVSSSEISRARPLAVYGGASALVVTLALVLRTLIHPSLVAEAVEIAEASARRLGRATRPPTARRATPGLRSALTALALLTGALAASLSALHVHSRALAREEQRAVRHLRAVTRASQLQLSTLPRRHLARWAAHFPADRRATPLVIGADGRVVAAAPSVHATARSHVELLARGRCRLAVSAPPLRCAVAPLPGGRRIVVVQSLDAARDAVTVGPTLALVSLGALLFAAVIGWRVGSEAARDISALAAQLRAMTSREDLDLHQPVVVTSIDAIGELTAAVGRLRYRLERELDSEEEAVRRTRRAEALKTQFIADVSHELRTPLNTLCGYSQLLLAGVEGPLTEPQTEDVRVIESAGKQLLGLVNDVLDMSVIDSGRLVLNVMRFDAAELCRSLVNEKRAIARRAARPIALEVDLDPPQVVVDSDPRRLRQVLQNLLSNALKFTDAGHIKLRLRVDERGDVVIVVSDTGVGIASDELERVFEQYRQAGAPSSRQQGSGLGLAICRRLTRALGGSISAESEPGVGSRFTVCLPRSIATSATGTTVAVMSTPEFSSASAPATAGTVGEPAPDGDARATTDDDA